MRLRWYDAGLARRLQRAAKARAKRSGVKGFQKRWWSASGSSGRNIFLLLWLSTIAIRAMVERLGQPMGVEVVTGSASLAFAGIALQRAKQLRKALTASFERVQSYFYPVPEREFLERTMLRSAFRAWWLVAAGIGLFRVLQEGDTFAVWTTASLGGLAEALVVLSLVYALEEYLEVIPRWLGLGFFGMAVLWLFTPQQYAVGQQMWLNALPTGWMNVVVTSHWPGERKIAALGGCVVVFGMVAWLLARRRCAKLLAVYERSLEPEQEIAGAESVETTEALSPSWKVLEGQGADLDETELEGGSAVQPLPMQATWQRQRIAAIGSEWAEYVRRGEWLGRWDWNQMPWIERVVGWWLNREEKATLTFLTGGKTPQWSNAWKNSVIALAAGVLLVAVVPAEWRFFGVLVLLVSAGLGLPLVGGRWMAMDPGWISGKLSPLYGAYPLGYGRGGRVMAKVALVRTAVWLPLLAVLAVVAAKLQNAGIGEGLWQATRVLMIWMSWLPITLIGKYSKGTNDSTNLRASFVIVVPLVIAAMVGMVILWGVLLVTESAWALLAGAGAIAGSVGMWALYGWWYNRKVDLLRDRQ
jgi:hypothetical protein